MATLPLNDLKKILLLARHFVILYNMFLETRSLESNKRCNDAFSILEGTLIEMGYLS